MMWVIVGITLRLIVIIHSNWRIDFDEAFNGLLAFDIMQGDLVLFTPPEVVGGTGTPYILASLFAVFGSSAHTFRLVSLIWSGLYILSTGWLAKSAYGEQVGMVAMALASLAPPYMLFVGMKIWSSYFETILLGNLLLLATYHLLKSSSRSQTIRWMVICGLLAGVMFWLTWLGFYYYLPVAIVIFWKGRQYLLRWGWVGVVAFAIGSLPFWVFNIPRGMPTIVRFLSDTPMTLEQILRVFIDFVTVRFPILVSGHPSWGYTGIIIVVILVAFYSVGLLLIMRRTRSASPMSIMLTLLMFSIPILYAISTHSRNVLPEFNPWGIDATGRYVLMLHSVLPIGGALLVHKIWKTHKQVARGVFIGVLSINTFGALAINHDRAFNSSYYDRLPHDLTPLIDFLNERDIQHIWVDGGIGHVLMFLTEERILSEDYHSVFLSGGLLRQPRVLEEIQNANPTVFITPIYEGQQNPPLQQALDKQLIDYEMVRVTSTLAVYIIPDMLDPMQIADGLGYQY